MTIDPTDPNLDNFDEPRKRVAVIAARLDSGPRANAGRARACVPGALRAVSDPESRRRRRRARARPGVLPEHSRRSPGARPAVPRAATRLGRAQRRRERLGLLRRRAAGRPGRRARACPAAAGTHDPRAHARRRIADDPRRGHGAGPVREQTRLVADRRGRRGAWRERLSTRRSARRRSAARATAGRPLHGTAAADSLSRAAARRRRLETAVAASVVRDRRSEPALAAPTGSSTTASWSHTPRGTAITWGSRRSRSTAGCADRRATALLAQNASALSLSMHGNDHVARDLDRLSTDAQARPRSRRHCAGSPHWSAAPG